MKKSTLIIGLALAAGVVGANNVLIKETAADGASGLSGKVKVVEQEDGGKAFLVEKISNVFSKKSFDIDPAKTYRLSVKIKALGDQPSLSYLGVMPLNEKGQYIQSHNVVVVKNSNTELAAACEPSDTVIKIKDGSKWIEGPRVIAFDIADDESDLPNYNVSPHIKTIEAKDGVYEVTLASKVGKAYPAGTKVRQHSMGGYVYAKAGKVPNEWTLWEGNLKGSQLRMGSAGRVVLLCNWGNDRDKDIVFDELAVKEVE